MGLALCGSSRCHGRNPRDRPLGWSAFRVPRNRIVRERTPPSPKDPRPRPCLLLDAPSVPARAHRPRGSLWVWPSDSSRSSGCTSSSRRRAIPPRSPPPHRLGWRGLMAARSRPGVTLVGRLTAPEFRSGGVWQSRGASRGPSASLEASRDLSPARLLPRRTARTPRARRTPRPAPLPSRHS